MTLLTPTQTLAAIREVMARNPDQRGDQQEACVPPEGDWRSDADSDVAAGKDEDRMWRNWP